MRLAATVALTGQFDRASERERSLHRRPIRASERGRKCSEEGRLKYIGTRASLKQEKVNKRGERER